MLTYLDVVAALEAKGWGVRLMDPDEELDGDPGFPEDILDDDFVDSPEDDLDDFGGEEVLYELIVEGKKIYFEFIGVQSDDTFVEAAMFSYENNETIVQPFFTELKPETVDGYVEVAETFFEDDVEETV